MEFILLVLAGLGGILLHLVAKFRDGVTKAPKNGNTFWERLKIVWYKFDLLGNLSYSVFALVVVIMFAAIRGSLVEIFPITYVTIIFVGYSADSALKNIKPEKIT